MTAWRSAAAQVLVADLDAPELDPDAAHHLGRVLRLRDGAEVCATDGVGGWRSCRFIGSGAIEPTGPAQHVAAPSPPLTVAFALTKGEKPELVVQKLTELGVDRIVPFVAQRSVVRWDAERAARQLARMRRVATEACAQCRRLWLPIIGVGPGRGLGPGVESSEASVPGVGEIAGDRVPTLGELPALLRSQPAPGELSEHDPVGGGLVVADAGGRALGRADRVVLIGPEGGWAPGEVEGLDRVTLGEHVLRAETAAIAAGALMVSLRAGTLAQIPSSE